MTNQRPVVSVIMVNRNGGPRLARALYTCRLAIERVLDTEPRLELIVVDNDSADEPMPVIHHELATAAFDWRVVPESRAGVNFARNAGLASAEGALIVFVDSDLEFDPGWMQGLVAAVHSHPEARVIGGRVSVGPLDNAPADWPLIAGPLMRTVFGAHCDYGDAIGEHPIDDTRGPAGPNMGFQRNVFAEFGVFDTRFGRQPGTLPTEVEFVDRLGRAGLRFLYVPDALVHHPLSKLEMTRAHVSARLREAGRAASRLHRIRGVQSPRLWGLTLAKVRELASASKQWLASCTRFDNAAARFHARGNVDFALGYLQEDFAEWLLHARTHLMQRSAAGPHKRHDRPVVQ